MTELQLGGLTPFTTIDFPGRLAAVLFCQGCPWRCAYCHNPHLQGRAPQAQAPVWAEVREWLRGRVGLLDGVVISGGEALLQAGLQDACREIRSMGFALAMHTGGAYPARLAEVLPLLDWVGFDFKAPFGDYNRITAGDAGERAEESLRLLLASGLACQVRTTVDARLLSLQDLARMAEQLAQRGGPPLHLQICRDSSGRVCPNSRRLIEQAVHALPGRVLSGE